MKKNKIVKDMVDLTKINVASTVGVISMNSLPSTPQAPALESAKAFAGQTFGLAATLQSTKSLMDTVEDFGKIGKKRRRR